MALFYLLVTLLAQSALISCQEKVQLEDVPVLTKAVPMAAAVVEEAASPAPEASSVPTTDLFDILLGTEGNFVPVVSDAAIEQITSADKSPGEKVEDVKNMTQKIMGAVKKEMEDLLNFALDRANNVTKNETERKKRSTDTPMDSTSLLMKLLTHLKYNNEHQNIALENMMTAQEIANEYGIEYNPDIDLLSNLIAAAAEKVKEITNIVKDADYNSETNDIEFVPLEETSKINDDTYYIYSVEPKVDHIHIKPVQASHHHHHHNHHVEPAVAADIRVPQVSHRRNVFESNDVSPISSPSAVEMESPLVEEPELNGEEHEEIISSKVFIEKGEEPGSACVNRVMTHTISDKGFFKTPKIQGLPQQMLYSFYLQ